MHFESYQLLADACFDTCWSYNTVFVGRKAQVLKALNRSTEAYKILQRLQVHCEKSKCTEVVIR